MLIYKCQKGENDMTKIFDKVNVTKKLIGKSEMTSGNAYRVNISYNGKRVWFVFNDNYLNSSSKKDLLDCLILDACSYDCCKSLTDFILEFGYEEMVEQGIKAYKGCKKQSDRLKKLFSSLELTQLQEELQAA